MGFFFFSLLCIGMAGSKQKLWLSKSTYLRSLQCPKALYLYKNFYQFRDKPSAKQQASFDRGHRVGRLAQLLFPGGIYIRPASPRGWPKAIEATSKLLANKQEIIYEAAFQHDGVMCAVDILVQNGSFYDVYEVKSSPGVRQVYIEDMALQYWVLRRQKIQLGKVYLLLPKKPQDGFIDLHMDDMEAIDYTEQLAAMVLDVEEGVRAAARTLTLDNAPEVAMGEQCLKPYPCDFQSTCKRGYR